MRSVDFEPLMKEVLNRVGLGFLILPDKFDETDVESRLDYLRALVRKSYSNMMDQCLSNKRCHVGIRDYRDRENYITNPAFNFKFKEINVNKFSGRVLSYANEWNTEINQEVMEYITSIYTDYIDNHKSK